jgi:hypothetical protein
VFPPTPPGAPISAELPFYLVLASSYCRPDGPGCILLWLSECRKLPRKPFRRRHRIREFGNLVPLL